MLREPLRFYAFDILFSPKAQIGFEKKYIARSFGWWLVAGAWC
jgi:hypothetical protein